MLHRVISIMYEIPIEYVCVMIMASVVLWIFSFFIFSNKTVWYTLNISLCVVAIIIIIAATLLGRTYDSVQIFLKPLSVFDKAKQHHDVYNQMILNVFLFVPIGLSMPFVIEKNIKRPVLWTIVCSVVFSCFIEILQYVFQKGYCEIDDVNLNTLGVVIGSLSYIISKFITRKLKRKS